MKRSVFILFILILSLQLISSVEISMNENFKQGETIIAKVSGNFLTSVTKDNVFFYKRHLRAPMEFDINKIGEDYYIYALTVGKEPENYSISIQNVQYMKGAEITDEDITKNFSITNEIAGFSVKPGFIVSPDNFYLEIQNLLEESLTINITTETEKRDIFILPEKTNSSSISLKSGEIKKINFEIGEGEPTFQTIKMSSSNAKTIITNTSCFLIFGNCTEQSDVTTSFGYEIPVYIYSGSTSSPSQQKNLNFNPSELIFSLNTSTTTKKTIILQNIGDVELTDISLSLSDSLLSSANLSASKVENLNPNKNFSLELSFFSSIEKDVEGILKAETENSSADLFISLKFLSYDYSNATGGISSQKTCAEKNGTLFNTETHKCDDEYENVKDGWCCYGTVSEIQKSSKGKIIAIIIILLVAGGLVWFYFTKYRKTKKPVDLLKIAKGKNNSFSKSRIDYNKFISPEKPNMSSEIRRPIIRTKPKIKVIEKPIIKEVEKKVFIEKPPKPVPKYTGSSNAKTYHLSSCKFSKLIDKKYKVQNDSDEYFRKNGYVPCKVCLGKD